jgi:hypothetical protein
MTGRDGSKIFGMFYGTEDEFGDLHPRFAEASVDLAYGGEGDEGMRTPAVRTMAKLYEGSRSVHAFLVLMGGE